jgi:hypothetical protein
MLTKGESHARSVNVADDVFISARLFPDMFPLSRQVQIACDVAARGAARLAGLEPPAFPDTETSFAHLILRARKALDFVQSVPKPAIDANEHVLIPVPMGQSMIEMTGRVYLQSFILPNMHFHAAIAYGLLRAQGVPLGKRDYLVPA